MIINWRILFFAGLAAVTVGAAMISVPISQMVFGSVLLAAVTIYKNRR